MGAPPLVLVSGKDVVSGAGGHQNYVRAHARAAAQLGFEPHVFCIGHRSRSTETEYGFVHHVAPQVPVVAQGTLLARAIVRFAGSHQPPAGVHGFGIWASSGPIASRALGRRGASVPAVASAYATRVYESQAMQGALPPHHARRLHLLYAAWLRWQRLADHRVEGWGYANSRLVLVNYDSVARILRSAYGPDLQIRKVAYAGEDALIDAAPPSRVGARPSRQAPLVLAISRQVPRKGLDVLLRALAELAAAGVPFRARLVGGGRMLEAHRRLALELGLDGRVELPGRVEDVAGDLAEADVFVLPSLAEASGSVSVLEALRAGTAVVSSACDGMPEDLVDGRDALLVPPGDAVALADALRELLCDEALRARIGAAGRAVYRERFSGPGFVAALGQAYADAGIRSG
jgi:glycosyltransferase involved in cell wall biosynthesis